MKNAILFLLSFLCCAVYGQVDQNGNPDKDTITTESEENKVLINKQNSIWQVTGIRQDFRCQPVQEQCTSITLVFFCRLFSNSIFSENPKASCSQRPFFCFQWLPDKSY